MRSATASRRHAKGVRTRIFEAMSDDPDFEYLIIDFHPRPCPSTRQGPKKGSEDQAIGLSHWGMSTKIHMAV